MEQSLSLILERWHSLLLQDVCIIPKQSVYFLKKKKR